MWWLVGATVVRIHWLAMMLLPKKLLHTDVSKRELGRILDLNELFFPVGNSSSGEF